MHQLKLHIRQYFFVGVLVFVLVGTGLISREVGLSKILQILKEYQTAGMLIYFIYSIVSTLILTLPIMPVWPVALFVYGFWPTVLLSLSGIVIGSTISFLLARHYGKPLVISMMGKRIFTEIEHLMHVDNPKIFLLIRMFGNNYFDAVSYVAGLTRLTYKTYIVVTAFTSFVWLVVMLNIIQQLGGLNNIKSFVTMMTLYGVVILAGTISWEVIHKTHRKHLKRKQYKR